MADQVRQSLKCGRCRLDRQKCRYNAPDAVCDRCKRYDYVCGPALAKPDAKQRKLNGRKCIECRNAKQKCLPEDRIWPKKCELCVRKGLPCSEPRSVKHSPKDPATVSEEISHRRSNLAAVAHLDHDDLEATKYQILSESLRFDRMDARQRNVASAIPGTCKWTILHPHFVQWMDESKRPIHNGFMWIKGKPGSGKSTLMKETLSQVRTAFPDHSVLSYFFNERAPTALEKSSLGLYRSLLYQLLQTHLRSRETFTEMFRSKARQGKVVEDWSVAELQNFLFKIVDEDRISSNVTIFIDALDEGQENDIRSMVNFLEELLCHDLPEFRVRICLSSRHYPHISVRHDLSIIVENESGHKRDIDLYTAAKLTRGVVTHLDEFQNKIRHRSAGMFLWVVLTVSKVNAMCDRGNSLATVLDRIDSIPESLSDLYADILSRDAENIDECIILLRWVSFSFRPLQPRELYVATQISSCISSPPIRDSTGKDFSDRDMVLRYILHSSRGLVEVSSAKPAVVQLIHRSLFEFLVNESSQENKLISLRNAKAIFSKFDADTCHIAIAEDSLRCLASLATESRAHIAHGSPLAFYAAGYWWQHGQMSKRKHENGFLSLANNLITNERSLRRWIHLYNHEMERSCQHEAIEHLDGSMLYHASWIGIVEIVKNVLRMGADVNAQGGKYGFALQAAAYKGHVDVVRLLIEAGADVNSSGGIYGNALQAAASGGWAKIVQTLLSTGADPNFRGGKYNTALHAAVFHKCKEVVRILLRGGADVNALNGACHSPLHVAVHNGNSEMVRLLMEMGAAPDNLGNEYATMLSTAASGDRLEKVNTLLRARADGTALRSYPDSRTYTMSSQNQCSAIRPLDGTATTIASGAWLDHTSMPSSYPRDISWSPRTRTGDADYLSTIDQVYDIPTWQTVIEPSTAIEATGMQFSHSEPLVNTFDLRPEFQIDSTSTDESWETQFEVHPGQLGQDAPVDLTGIGSAINWECTYSSLLLPHESQEPESSNLANSSRFF